MRLLLGPVLVLLVSLPCYSQSSAPDTFSSSMMLREGISISCGNMKFADRVAGQSYGANTLQSHHGPQYSGFAGGNDAVCTVSGYSGATYNVTLPS